METGDGVVAWVFLRRVEEYETAWREHRASVGTPAMPEPGPFPIRVQTEMDLAAARFDLLAWENPWRDGGPASPFWVQTGMLRGLLDPEAEPVTAMVAEGGSVEAKARTLIAHEASGFEEWGASGSVRLDPGASGRGLSFSLAPSWGAASSGVEGLWSARDARGFAPGGTFEPESRLDAELGYGFAAGGGFTGTPYAGMGLTDHGRDWRLGWRLAPAGAPVDFALGLEGTRRESANDDTPPEHGLMLRGAVRW